MHPSGTMRRFQSWMGRVLPPASTTWTAVVILLTMRLGHEWLAAQANAGDDFDRMLWDHVLQLWSRVLTATATVAGAIYGLERALRRNPLARGMYRDWLVRTPWESPEPLPWGNVLPAVQDLVPLTFLTGIAVGAAPGMEWLFPAAGALAMYSFVLFIVLLNWRPSLGLYPLLWIAALALASRNWPARWFSLLCVDVAIVSWFAHLALRDVRRLDGPRLQHEPDCPRAVSLARPMGRPWAALAPHACGTVVSWPNACCLGVTAGLLFWGLCHVLPQGAVSEVWMMTLATVFCAGARYLGYRVMAHSPLSVLGRLRTGRLIIPGYDQILLPPLLIALVGMAVTGLVTPLPILGSTKMAIVLGVCIFLMFGLPPSRDRWVLLGENRLSLRSGAGQTGNGTARKRRRD